MAIVKSPSDLQVPTQSSVREMRRNLGQNERIPRHRPGGPLSKYFGGNMIRQLVLMLCLTGVYSIAQKEGMTLVTSPCRGMRGNAGSHNKEE